MYSFTEVNNLSEANFVAPYKFVGLQALSVDRAITFLILFFKDKSIILEAPIIFVLIHSIGFSSAVVTIFKAAA